MILLECSPKARNILSSSGNLEQNRVTHRAGLKRSLLNTANINAPYARQEGAALFPGEPGADVTAKLLMGSGWWLFAQAL